MAEYPVAECAFSFFVMHRCVSCTTRKGPVESPGAMSNLVCAFISGLEFMILCWSSSSFAQRSAGRSLTRNKRTSVLRKSVLIRPEVKDRSS